MDSVSKTICQDLAGSFICTLKYSDCGFGIITPLHYAISNLLDFPTVL